MQRMLGMPYPREHQSNFIHLYMDIFWFGVLNGSTLIFLAVYISRLGASPFQTGLLTAAPALCNLLFSIPAGRFGQGKPLHIVTRWAWFANRIFCLLLIPLPLILPGATQIWVILGIVLVMTIPGTLATVIGNAFFAETVPLEWRGQVVGLRNALLAVATMFTSFSVGQVLNRLPFESGYRVVFAIGFLGAMLSCLHLFFIKPVPAESKPGMKLPDGIPATLRGKMNLRLDILKSPFSRILLATLAVQLAVFIPNPIFPLYQVNILHLSDRTISLGSSLFWII